MQVSKIAALCGLVLVSPLALAETIAIAPSADAQMEIQEALILAEPGTTIELTEGTYHMTMGLSLDVDDVTIRGKGLDKTVLSFKEQDAGSEGLLVTSDGVTIEDLAFEDTKGNCFKSNGASELTLRNVRTEWTNGPHEDNGAYGLYPVSSENVLIEGCVAIGASDAGIYVGQTKNVIVRNSRAEYNVAGIEIENCHGADVYNCIATNNTGGILVFDLPGLPMQKGHDVRVFDNKVYDNDTPNFAPKGNIVGGVAQGSGIIVMANSRVEIFNNDIRDHRTYNVVISSYFASGRPIEDENYYPYAESIYVHGNTFGKGGWDPTGLNVALVTGIIGDTFPDILWDGTVNAKKIDAGELPANANIIIRDNTKEEGELTFTNLNLPKNLEEYSVDMVTHDLAPHVADFPRLDPIVLAQTK